MLRFLTAGESHGMALNGIIEGLPAGLKLDEEAINGYLVRRQKSHGRGNRMKKIEKDRVIITGGVRNGVTIASPLALTIENKDWKNRKDRKATVKRIPRPGHADLAGVMKYGFDDIQNVIERSSARETAMRTSVGAVAKILLEEFGVEIIGHTTSIGKIKSRGTDVSADDFKEKVFGSPVYCYDSKVSKKMCDEIDAARAAGDTLGGTVDIVVLNVPPGLGSYVHWDRKIEGRLGQAMLSIPSVKAVEFGEGVENAARRGSRAHDRINKKAGSIVRQSNRAGGIEGGVTNGQPLIIRAYAKPISSLRKPLESVNLKTRKKTKAPYVRSDVCVVPAITVIGEAMIAWVLADALLEKFGSDSIDEIRRNLGNFMSKLKTNWDNSESE